MARKASFQDRVGFWIFTACAISLGLRSIWSCQKPFCWRFGFLSAVQKSFTFSELCKTIIWNLLPFLLNVWGFLDISTAGTACWSPCSLNLLRGITAWSCGILYADEIWIDLKHLTVLNNLPGSVIKVLASEAECRAYLTCLWLSQPGFSCSPFSTAKKKKSVICPAKNNSYFLLLGLPSALCLMEFFVLEEARKKLRRANCPLYCSSAALAIEPMERVQAVIC